MAISIIDNFTVNTTKNIDSRLGPYASVAQATGSISTLLRYEGMTVTITGSGTPVEYWFSPTTASTDFVIKTASVTGFVTTSSFNQYTGSSTSQFAGTSSFAATASFAPLYLPLTGGTINGNVTVNGTASIAFLNVQYESASVIYSSGSNVFGDATNDTQTLIGTVIVSGSQQITGSLRISSSEANQLLIGNVISQIPSFGSSPNVTIGSGSGGGVLDIRNTSTSSPNATNVGTIQFTVQTSGIGTYTQTQLKSISAGDQSGGNSGGGHLTFLTSIGETGAVPLERMRITSAGNVGIGTNNPLSKLHAEGERTGPIIAISRSILIADNTSTGGTYNNAVGLYANVNTTDGIAVYGNSTSPSGYGGYFVGKGHFSGTITTDGSASISGSVTAASGLIGPGASLAAPIFNGFVPNLSIGTPTGSSGAVLNLTNTSVGTISAGDTLGTIQFAGTDYPNNSQPYVSSQIRATVTQQVGTGNPGGGNVAIWTSTTGNGTSPIERMRVNSNGQVLIGVTSSLDITSKLIVSGSTIVTGSVTAIAGFIKPGAGSEYLLADGTTTAGVSGGTSIGLVQAMTQGLQNLF